jgi:hypothetical protein
MAMVEDIDMRNTRPLFVIDQHGVMQYLDTPALADLRRLDHAPLVALNYTTLPNPVLSAN